MRVVDVDVERVAIDPETIRIGRRREEHCSLLEDPGDLLDGVGNLA